MATEELAIVGTYTDGDSEGIYTVAVDGDGAVDVRDATEAGENPSFLAIHPSGDYCYAVNEIDDGAVTALSIGDDGELERLNQITTGGGADPCYCTVDATGQYLLVAHYTGGTVAMCPIADDGQIETPSALVEHEGAGPNEERQEAAHPHSINPGPDNDFAYVPDLGDDRVVGYELDLDAGELVQSEEATVELPAGAGPRHMAFGPVGDYAYLINELNSTVTVLDRNADTGALTAVDTAPTLPDDAEGENITADIHVHDSNEWVFGSNRGHDSVATFAIDDGSITFEGTESTQGEWPRNFALTPDGDHLLAENMESNDIVTFAVEAETGRLDATGAVTEIPSPVCLQFL